MKKNAFKKISTSFARVNCKNLYSKGSQGKVDSIFRIKSKVTCVVLIKFVIHKPNQKLKYLESEEELIFKVKLSRDGGETNLLRTSERTQWWLQQEVRGDGRSFPRNFRGGKAEVSLFEEAVYALEMEEKEAL